MAAIIAIGNFRQACSIPAPALSSLEARHVSLATRVFRVAHHRRSLTATVPLRGRPFLDGRLLGRQTIGGKTHFLRRTRLGGFCRYCATRTGDGRIDRDACRRSRAGISGRNRCDTIGHQFAGQHPMTHFAPQFHILVHSQMPRRGVRLVTVIPSQALLTIPRVD